MSVPRLVARAAVGLALASLGAACSAPVLPERLREAERLEHDGRHDEALRAYDEELRACGSDAPRCGMAALGRARVLEHAGRTAAAIAAYEAVPALDRHGRTPARALYRAAEVAVRAGQLERGLADAWRAVREYPRTVPAEDAVRLIVARMRLHGRARELYAQLGAVAAAVPDTDVADNLLLMQGEVAERDLDDPAAAVRIFDHLAARYPESSLRDDALWRAARIQRARRDPQGAIARLRQITSQRRVALFTGSYISEWLDDALLLIGRIYLEDLGDPRHAVVAFTDLRDHFASSVLRDDAQIWIARAHLAAGERESVCQALRRLAQEFPRSKYLRSDAPALRARAGCGQ